MSDMNRRISVIFLTFLIVWGALGCSPGQLPTPLEQAPKPNTDTAPPQESLKEARNPALEKFALGDLPEGTLAVILNNPTEKDLDQIKMYETYSYDNLGEKQLLMPVYPGSKVQVIGVSYNEAGFFTKEKVLCSSVTDEKEYALLVESVRPEGAPYLMFQVDYDGQVTEYVLSYNGKEGTPHLEYLKTGDRINQNQVSLEGNPFSYQEIEQIFFMSEKDITDIYGKPDERTEFPFLEEGQAAELHYKNSVFQVEYSTDPENGVVFYAAIEDDKIKAPRGILIGDTIEQVLGKFPNEGDTKRVVYDEETKQSYQLLYGNYEHMEDAGIVDYTQGVPVGITYFNEGASLTFELEEGKVKRVCYAISLI